MTEIKAECKTCKNPYCSRTIGERQKQEVQHHFQFAWECTDKEKYVQSDGGYVLVEKKDLENITSIADYQQTCNMKRHFIIKDLESDKRRLQATLSELSSEFNRRIAEYEDLLKWHEGELPEITKKNKSTLYLAWTKYGRAGSPAIVTPLKAKYMNLWTGAIIDKGDVVSWKEIKLPTE